MYRTKFQVLDCKN